MTSTDKSVHLLDFLVVFQTLYKLLIYSLNISSVTALLRQIGLFFDLCKLFSTSEHETF